MGSASALCITLTVLKTSIPSPFPRPPLQPEGSQTLQSLLASSSSFWLLFSRPSPTFLRDLLPFTETATQTAAIGGHERAREQLACLQHTLRWGVIEQDQRSELVCRARLKALAFGQQGRHSLSGFARLWSKGEGRGQQESGQRDNYFLTKGFHCPAISVSARIRRDQDGLF